MTVDATVAEPTHHVTLFETGGSTRGLVLCDAKGLADHRQITKTPMRRMPLKMQQGDSLWSDFELPYQNEAQDDWSGGRGLRNFEDSTRYWHSFMVNTMHKNKAFLGPQPCLTDGYRVHNHDLYGNTTFQGLYGSTEYLARKFTAAGSYTGRRAELFAKKVGTPNGNLTVALHAAGAWDQVFDEEIADFDTVFPAWPKELDAVADFDSETDADGDLNDHADAAHDGAVGLEITFDDNNTAYGSLDLLALSTTGAVSFWFNKNDMVHDGSTVIASFKPAPASEKWNIIFNGDDDLVFRALTDASGALDVDDIAVGSGWHHYLFFFKASTGAGQDNGWMRVFVDDVLAGSVTGIDNDLATWDEGLFGMTFSSSTSHGGSYYMDTIKIDPVGAPFASKLAAKNGTYGLAVPTIDGATLMRVDFTGPNNETVFTAESWIYLHPDTIVMTDNDSLGIGRGMGSGPGGDPILLHIVRDAAAGYEYQLKTETDVGEEATAFYAVTSGWHHIRIVWGASTGAGNDDGYAYLYIDGALKEALTGLDNDQHDVDIMRFGAIFSLQPTTYGIIYFDDCKWSNASPYSPGSVLTGVTDTDSSAFTWISQMIQLTFGTAGTLVSGTDYWIVAYGHASDDADNHWAIGVNDTIGMDAVAQSVDGSAWLDASVSPYYHVTDWKDDFIANLFEYKGQMYFTDRQDDGGTPKLYMNGERGRSIGASSTTTLEHTGKTWTTNEWADHILVIVGGTGIGQWRKISSNDADTLTVDTAWEVTPVTANTEYVILGSNTWTEIPTTGLTGPVTDVLVVKDAVYFAQGEAVNIRRFNYAANSNSFDDDGTNKATFIELVHELGGAQVYKANNAAVSVTVARADPAVWGTDLVFGTAIDCGSSAVPITGLERYFDPEYCIVLKEDQVGRIVSNEYQVMPIREFIAAKSDHTGKASTVAGVYLYLTAMRGLERYYQNRLDDVGPNLDDGMRADHQGPIYDLLSFPGRIYAAVSGEDWGTSSYGSIQVHNGLGWHSWYRSQLAGSKIRKIHHQVIPGSTPDRVWVSEGGDVIWLHMPSEQLDPRRDSNYKYFHEGMLQTSAMSLRLKDIPKTLNSINIWAESLATDTQFITVRYEIDWDGTQVDLSGNIDTLPTEELDISSSGSQVQCRNVHFILVFHTTDETKSPELKATVLEAVAHLPTKFKYSVQFRAGDENIDLRGDEESYAVGTFIATLEAWANAGTQLTMRHHNEGGPMDNKTVFITAPTLRPILNIDDENLASYLCTMEIIEA